MKIETPGIILAAALSSSITLHAAEKSARPNIVFIVSDDQAWGDYGFMGHPHLATPNLDKLAAQSLTFQRGDVALDAANPLPAGLAGRSRLRRRKAPFTRVFAEA